MITPTMVSQLSLNRPAKINTIEIAVLIETARRVADGRSFVRAMKARRMRPPSSGYAGTRLRSAIYKLAQTMLRGRLRGDRNGQLQSSTLGVAEASTAIART